MKLSEVVGITEGVFSDLAGAVTHRDEDPADRQKRISDAAKPLFIKDFKDDFYADLNRYLKDNAINVSPSPAPITETFSYEYLNSIVESFMVEDIDDAIKQLQTVSHPKITSGEIQSPQELEQFLEKNNRVLWNNATLMANKSYVLKQIWNSAPQPDTITKKPRLGRWVEKWFSAYMQGISWKNQEAAVKKIAAEMEASFNPAKGSASIVKLDDLANLSWEITKSSSALPSGASNIRYNADTPNMKEQFAKWLEDLKKKPEYRSTLDSLGLTPKN